jgi:hypothetical protein
MPAKVAKFKSVGQKAALFKLGIFRQRYILSYSMLEFEGWWVQRPTAHFISRPAIFKDLTHKCMPELLNMTGAYSKE